MGRNYHSEALLLPDGRVVTMGSDPIYARNGRDPGTFEQRIEIYSPPYLFQGARPRISGLSSAFNCAALSPSRPSLSIS